MSQISKNDNRPKPYDKSRQYKKHTGNKSEGHGFAELRKQKIKRGYSKLLKKQEKKRIREGQGGETQTTLIETVDGEESTRNRTAPTNDKTQNLNRFSKAKEEFEIRKAEELKQKEEALKNKEERDEAIRKYNQKKEDKHKKFKIRTSKGQPIMKYRMQDLLQQIQTMKSDNKL